MDHLSWPLRHRKPKPLIPYLLNGLEDTICDDIAKLAVWPTVMDWTQSSAYADDHQFFHEAARRCQAWLYFGLIRIICDTVGQHFKVTDFIIESDASLFIDSSLVADLLNRLPRILFVQYGALERLLGPRFLNSDPQWMMTSIGEVLYSGLKDTVRVALPWLIDVVQHYEKRLGIHDLWTSQLFTSFLAPLILLEQICQIGYVKIDPLGQAQIDLIRDCIRPFALLTSGLAISFKIVGLCPTVLKRGQYSPLEAFRILSIPCKASGDHSMCQDRTCVSFNIDPVTYRPQHTKQCSGSNCSMLRVSISDLHRLISEGKIPLIASRVESSGHLNIQIVDSVDVKSYVAISHVWAGGLGNFQDNAHYQCQLYQLHKDICKHSVLSRFRSRETRYYWLDTLCIPAQQGTLKKKAIDAMATIYAGASSVLVIDPQLLELESRNLDLNQIDLALISSPWMARSWTLQEGALAIDIKIKLADATMPYSTLQTQDGFLVSMLRTQPDVKSGHVGRTMIQAVWDVEVKDVIDMSPLTSSNIVKLLFDAIESITDPLPDPPPWHRFVQVWNELSARSSTQTDDLPAILAALLGHSAGEVLLLQPKTRMHALLRSQASLPTSLLLVDRVLDTDIWCPDFPTCKNTLRLSRSLGSMSFMPNSFLLKLTTTTHFRVLFCDKAIPVSGHIRVHDNRADVCCSIQFANRVSKQPDVAEENVLLLFCTLHLRDSNVVEYDGLCLKMNQIDEQGYHVKFLNTFTWRRSQDCNKGLGLNVNIEQHQRSAQENSTTSEINHFDIASVLESSDISEELPILIDIGASSWPQLSWSRPAFYPFVQTSQRVAQPLIVFPWLAILSIVYTCVVELPGVGVYTFDRFKPKLAAFYLGQALLFAVVRILLSDFETQYFRKLANRHLQRIWAASFSTSLVAHDQKFRLLTRHNLALLTFYGSLFVWSTVETVHIFNRALADRSRPQANPILEAIRNPDLKDQIWRCVFLELTIRLIVLTLSDPLEIVAVLRQRLRRDRGSDQIPLHTDRRHMYAVVCVAIIVVPLLIFAIAVNIKAVVRHEDPGPISTAISAILAIFGIIVFTSVCWAISQVNSFGWIRSAGARIRCSILQGLLIIRQSLRSEPDGQIQL